MDKIFQQDFKKIRSNFFKIQIKTIKFWNFECLEVFEDAESISIIKNVIKT